MQNRPAPRTFSLRHRLVAGVFRATFVGGLALLGSLPAIATLPLSIPDEASEEGVNPDEVPPLSPEEAAANARFREPQLTPEEEEFVAGQYSHVDPDGVIPRSLLDKALAWFDTNKAEIPNQRFLTVINFSSPSRRARMFIINMETGAVTALHMAHGSGSDPNNTGIAQRFSNTPNSKMSSVGVYKTAETYQGKHGLSLRLDGLSPTNSKARERAVVVHGADYVEDEDIKPGRSWGCPAVSMANHVRVINSIKGGSILFAGLVE
jgi:hypothetical protein